MANTRFLGMQYPLVKTARGVLAQKSGVDQIKADILQLLLTNPGERVMLPEFGTPLRQLCFEPNDSLLEKKAKDIIAKAIQTWEPRVVIEKLEVTSKVDSSDLHPDDPRQDIDNILMIKISFIDPNNIQEVNELQLELPIAGV
jgi:phage baseplate assembly protein W